MFLVFLNVISGQSIPYVREKDKNGPSNDSEANIVMGE